MIRDRRRIANKLMRIQEFLKNQSPINWEAVYDVDRLRRSASYDADWKWEGYASELEWARAQSSTKVPLTQN